MNRIARNTGLATLALTMSLGMAACSGDDADTDTGTDTTSETSSPSEEPTTEPTEEETATEEDPGAQTIGASCDAIPTDPSDPGSFVGMATEPVATAASGNPLLKTLVAAVTEAGLGDTLNSAPAITVFAPTDDAFAKIDAETMDTVMGDKKLLTTILTNHVVEGQLAPDAVVGKQTSLAGGNLTIKGEGDNLTVKSKGTKMSAVLCGNIPTANATVYVVDTVLLP